MKVSTESMPKELVSGNGETILLADDEEMILEMCADILEGLNYRVLKASNGIEALEIFESNMSNIDLAILDVVMPHLGGIEAGYLCANKSGIEDVVCQRIRSKSDID